jgi:hypothetical protein
MPCLFLLGLSASQTKSWVLATKGILWDGGIHIGVSGKKNHGTRPGWHQIIKNKIKPKVREVIHFCSAGRRTQGWVKVPQLNPVICFFFLFFVGAGDQTQG